MFLGEIASIRPADSSESMVVVSLHISGNTFSNLQPTSAGSCIVALSGNTVRVTENIFENVKNAVDNRIGASLYYDPDDNIVK